MKLAIFVLVLFQSIISFSQCDNFEMTVTSTNPICPGYCDGSISVNVSGANGSIKGQITNSSGAIILAGAMGTSPNNVCAGWYYVYVTDDLGCELYDSVYLESPAEMEAILNITLPTSTTACDGIVEVDTVLHHIGSYSNLAFYWNPGGPDGVGQTTLNGACYGNYSLTVNNEVGCGMTMEFSIGNLSSGNLETVTKLEFYPYPFQSELNFTSNESEILELIIYSLDGKEILLKKIVDENKIDVSELATGNYILKVITESGVYSVQIFKE